MKRNYDDRAKEWWPMKNGTCLVTLENDAGVDDQDIAKSFNEVPCRLCSYILGRSKGIMKIVIREIDGF